MTSLTFSRAMSALIKTDFDNITILDRGVKNTFHRRIKESIFIHKELQSKLNKDCGRDFPKIYSCLLATKQLLVQVQPSKEKKLAVSKCLKMRLENISKVILIFLVCSVDSFKHLCLYLNLFCICTKKRGFSNAWLVL